MKTSTFIEKYTTGNKFTLLDVCGEFLELVEACIKLDKAGIKEELSDTAVFLQLHLYGNYGLDREFWTVSVPSAEKFIARRHVWKKIYEHVGLKKTPRILKNYKRKHKVIEILAEEGISEKKAVSAYECVVLPMV